MTHADGGQKGDSACGKSNIYIYTAIIDATEGHKTKCLAVLWCGFSFAKWTLCGTGQTPQDAGTGH